MKKTVKIVLWSIAGLFAVLLLFSCFRTIPAGYAGVRTQFGAVVGNSVSAGLNFKIPFVQNIEKVDCRVQKLESATVAASKDLQTVTSNIAVNFSIVPENATTLFKEVGLNYKSVIIDPAVQETVKMVTAQYTAEELITKRGEVSIQMKQVLSDKISKHGIAIMDFNVVNFDFSDEFNKAIELKQVAQQQALKAEQDLSRIKIEAEQKIVQAQAEAESLRIQKQEITTELLELRKIEAQLRAIEKWNGELPNVTGDNIPFISIDQNK